MSFWTAVVIISVAGILFGTVEKVAKTFSQRRVRHGQVEESLRAMEGRLSQMEERMANIESIVLEQEKHRHFDEALQ